MTPEADSESHRYGGTAPVLTMSRQDPLRTLRPVSRKMSRMKSQPTPEY